MFFFSFFGGAVTFFTQLCTWLHL